MTIGASKWRLSFVHKIGGLERPAARELEKESNDKERCRDDEVQNDGFIRPTNMILLIQIWMRSNAANWQWKIENKSEGDSNGKSEKSCHDDISDAREDVSSRVDFSDYFSLSIRCIPCHSALNQWNHICLWTPSFCTSSSTPLLVIPFLHIWYLVIYSDFCISNMPGNWPV